MLSLNSIHVLDFSVANLIAAGEVVERPASAIKELLENAIDAGGKKIAVEIRNGGISFIRVTDDGCGMHRDDVPVCIRRHATSKIKNAEDLDGIETLGFRGEALAAIASVSKLRIITRSADEDVGTLMECENGEPVEIRDTGCAQGTTVIVEELFANVPARRKFLKKDSSETAAVSAVLEKVALSRPDVSFSFIADGMLRFRTEGDGSLKNAVWAVLGRDFAKRLLPVRSLTNGISIEGFIGSPELVRANRGNENFFINGRYVRCSTAAAALEQAYHSFIPTDKFPGCVMSITMHPALVDVNVHPAKLEVKFASEKTVFETIYACVRGALLGSDKRPEFDLSAPRPAGSSAFSPSAGKTEGETGKSSVFAEPEEKGNSAVTSAYRTPGSPELTEELRTHPVDLPKIVSVPVPVSSSVSADPERNAEDDQEPGKKDQPAPIRAEEPAPRRPGVIDRFVPLPDPYEKKQPIDRTLFETAEALPQTDEHPAPTDPAIAGEKTDNTEKTAKTEREAPKPYKVLGVAFETYIFVELPGKTRNEGQLLMIDKHAAHERILFEKMKRRRSENEDSAGFSQLLLVPVTLNLDGTEKETLNEYAEDVRAIGFDFSFSEGTDSVSITQIPSYLTPEAAADAVYELISGLNSGTGGAGAAKEVLFEKALYQASCKAAVKAGIPDGEEDIRWICDQLIENPEIRFCPHGRPVAFEMSKHDIEHRFKRV